MNTEEIRTGVGYTNLTLTSTPNFCDERGTIFMGKCPKCKKENYSLNVASGICSWCRFDLNKFINS